MSNDAVTIERRKAYRLPVQLKIKYVVANVSGGASETFLGVTKNISESGLLFESGSQIPLDAALSISISMPGLPPQLIELQAKVVRIDKIAPSQYDIGVNFIEVPDAKREIIKIRVERMNLLKLLAKASKNDVSDLHLTVNSPPMGRHYGELKPLAPDPLSPEEIRQMIYSIITEEQKQRFHANKDLDFSFSPSAELRYRVSIYQQRGSVEVVFRNILPAVKNRDELGLPDVIDDLCVLKDGLVIIGGTTGSGKSTTITTMIDIINKKIGGVILSLEKPIEYLHTNIKGIIKQREVGTDVPSFASGLKAALRQDPDIIVVGEVLDSDTIETVLQAAETGHLVITSLHATDTVQVFDRIVSIFPLDQRDFIYSRLSHSIKAIIIQKLLPHKSGIGRVIATDVCVMNTAVRRIIRSGDFTQLPSVMQTGSKYKMHLMQDSIDKLFQQGLISGETYEMYSKSQ
jgi:twitching motility protein PilT